MTGRLPAGTVSDSTKQQLTQLHAFCETRDDILNGTRPGSSTFFT